MGTDKETTEKETTDQETAEKGMQTREDSIRRDYGFASDVELKECRYCRVMIPKKAKVCPNCRMNLKRHWFRNTVAVVFAIAVIGVGGYYLSEHWGIMRDAVMSVWMAQDGTAVPAVSVTTVGTAELAAGAASAETSEVANSAKTGGQEADPAETSTQTPAQTSADTSERSQSRETDENQADSDKASEKETTGSDGSDAGALSEDETEVEQNAKNDDAVSGITAEKENTAASDTEDEETTDSADRKDSGQDTSEEKDTVKAATNTTDSDKEKDRETEASEEEEQTFRDGCVEISYKTLLRNTEACLDTGLKVELQVVCQVIGGLFDENIYYLCKVEEVSGIERYYIIRDDREADDTLILEGDTLTVYGQLFGTCKLPAGLIETRPTVPAVSMLYFDLTEE